jgi:adenylyltransferase/sulfurtransferase
MPAMDDSQLLRYSRQILLPQVGIEGQRRLLAATALVVGAGGLGSPVALYLAAAGVGHIVIADPDLVEISNLQRQILHATPDLDRLKVDSAKDRLRALNPDVRVSAVPDRLTGELLREQVDRADVIIDGSDNFATRFAVNAACVAARKPLVSGAVIRLEGQVAVFRPDQVDSPCYRCLYQMEEELEESCTETGVLAPVAGIVGSIQATEALKLLAGIGQPLVGRLLIIDAATMDVRILRMSRDPHCPVCARPVP